jgi:PAS domain S-box-containing protein
VRSYGFVNAVFEDKTLFTDIFGDAPDDTVRFEVIDDSTGKELFVHNAEEAPGVTVPQKVSTIDVAGQRWRVALFTPAHYGQEGLERYYPLAILVGGGMLAALGGGFLVIQARRREHALDLAGAMTEDLNNERNMAVATQQKDEAILSSIGDAVFAIDMDGHITLFNPVAERLSGWRRADAIGRPYKDVLHFELESTGKVSDDFIRRALAGHPAAMNRHTILVRKDGKRIAVADSAAPIRDADDRILGVIVIFRDVSKEQELDRAKSEFVSLASHQLRTPLSAIKWYGEMLLSGDSGKLNPEQQEHVQEVFDGNERMIELVNSLLDVSRLDLGKLTNEPTPTVLADVADSLAKELATAIAGKQLQFKMDIDRKMAPVVADPKLLRMVLQNLMSNAVKYTPPKGSVTVTVRLAKHAEVVKSGSRSEAPHIYIAVTDTGYGIPKAQQYKIFGKLFRADNVRAMDVEGTGLGLYIVKQVAQKLGGDVWFHSVENAGTTFHLVFPVDTRRRKS